MIVDLDRISDNALYDLADLFKVFSDSTRMRIMYMLFDEAVSVNEIAASLDMSQSAISHQLRYLKKNNLVKSKRDGKSNIYSLADDHVKIIIATGLEHILEKNKRSIHMKKKFKIEGLDCANCAAKIEENLAKLEGVNSVSVSFLTEKVKFDLIDDCDVDKLIKDANVIADRIEPGSKIVG